MGTFFNASIVTADAVRGIPFSKVSTYSEDGENLGELIVKICDDIKKSVFLKYLPYEVSDCKKNIFEFKIIGDDTCKIKEFLQSFRDKVYKESLKAFSTDAEKYCFYQTVYSVIFPNDNSIHMTVPVNNKFVTRVIGDRWIGIDLFVEPDIIKIISEFIVSE